MVRSNAADVFRASTDAMLCCVACLSTDSMYGAVVILFVFDLSFITSRMAELIREHVITHASTGQLCYNPPTDLLQMHCFKTPAWSVLDHCPQTLKT